MKKILIILCGMLMLLSLTACGNKEKPKTNYKASNSSSKKVEESSKNIDWEPVLTDYSNWVLKYNDYLTQYKIELNKIGQEMYTENIKLYDPNAVGEDGVAGGALPDISDPMQKQVEAQNKLISEYSNMVSESGQWSQKLNNIKDSLTGDNLERFNDRLNQIEQTRVQVLTDIKSATMQDNNS
ncbi:LptM family lipoprotein [Paraclostridium dentum]|uniref:LptM family lipoprotein n=1 Tax=Paraclostridium dentum TaxID=2662455 RepID=UPI003F36930D